MTLTCSSCYENSWRIIIRSVAADFKLDADSYQLLEINWIVCHLPLPLSLNNIFY